MKTLEKYWRVFLALVMAVLAVLVAVMIYRPGQRDYETQRGELNSSIAGLRQTMAANARYAGVQDQLPAAREALEESRLELYRHFPKELKEEDQILYVLYLEELFGSEITFQFGTVSSIGVLSDGAVLGGLTLTVNYETTYQGFQDMITDLATDSRITSIQYAAMSYDEENDRAAGSLTLLCYVLDSGLLEYQEPDVTVPDVGKSNIFE